MLCKRIPAVLLAVILISGCVFLSVSADFKDSEPSFLKTHGSLIYDERNNPVALRGTNLGGWLIWESWMNPFTGAEDSCSLIEGLQARFGDEKADRIIQTFLDNYITEADFDTIQALGFNCIRLPFWYKTLETGKAGEYDFSRLDFAVEMCRARGIYIVLDCHGLPGFQSLSDHCGRANACRLYDRTEEGAYYRAESVRLWEAVATHYQNEPVIAAYDLMNEPMCDFNELQDDEVMWEVYDLLYKAVRKIDSRHIIVMEGIWDFSHLPDPAVYGWQNVMYELHSYNATNEEYRQLVADAELSGYCVPIYEGEFHPSSPDASWDYICGLFNRNNISWTSWTYKGYCPDGENDWFLFCCSDPAVCVDLEHDSYETILSKCGAPLHTSSGWYAMGQVETLRQFAGQEYVVPASARLRASCQKLLFNCKLRLFSLIRTEKVKN